MREVVSEFRNPVMLYSIGKDFERDAACRAQGLLSGAAAVLAAARRYDLEISRDDRLSRRYGEAARPRPSRSHQRRRRRARHIASRLGQPGPYPGDEDRGVATGARRRQVRRGLRRRASRRGEEPRQGAHLLASLRRARVGPAQSAAGTLEALQHAHSRGRVDARVSAVELDRARRLGIYPRRGDSCRSPLFRQGASGRRARRHADHGRRRSSAAAARRDAADAARPLPHARMLSAHGRDSNRTPIRSTRSSTKCGSPRPPRGRGG